MISGNTILVSRAFLSFYVLIIINVILTESMKGEKLPVK